MMSVATAREVVNVINGLLRLAKIAMPDTYFQTDRRVQKAKQLLRKLKGQNL